MAFNFVNAQQICTISLTDVYTCPSTNVSGNVSASVTLLLQATNVTNRADTITVTWTSSTSGNSVARLVYQLPVPANTSVSCLTGKLVLKVGDKIRAQCGTHQAIEMSFSGLETS